jgi:uncharacterized membrane protein required for colicin V production
MVSASIALWTLVVAFALIGSMRNARREFLVTVSIFLGMYVCYVLGPTLIALLTTGQARIAPSAAQTGARTSDLVTNLLNSLIVARGQTAADQESAQIARWVALSVPFLFVVFLGYLGPVVAGKAVQGNIIEKTRTQFTERLTSGFIGAFNGHLIVSTLFWNAVTNGVVRTLVTPNTKFPAASATPVFVMPSNFPPGFEAGNYWQSLFFYSFSPPNLLSEQWMVVLVVVCFLIVLYAYV